MNDKDYYQILDIDTNTVDPRTLTDQQIKTAYRDKAKKVHPDLNPKEKEKFTKQMQEVNEAYEFLKNPEKRESYNKAYQPDNKENEKLNKDGINNDFKQSTSSSYADEKIEKEQRSARKSYSGNFSQRKSFEEEYSGFINNEPFKERQSSYSNIESLRFAFVDKQQEKINSYFQINKVISLINEMYEQKRRDLALLMLSFIKGKELYISDITITQETLNDKTELQNKVNLLQEFMRCMDYIKVKTDMSKPNSLILPELKYQMLTSRDKFTKEMIDLIEMSLKKMGLNEIALGMEIMREAVIRGMDFMKVLNTLEQVKEAYGEITLDQLEKLRDDNFDIEVFKRELDIPSENKLN